jgi:hypothetical protein
LGNFEKRGGLQSATPRVALGTVRLQLKGYQFENSSEYGAVFGLYSCAKGKSPILLSTFQITFTKQNKVRLFPTLPGKRENDFMKLAQNRFHKKTVLPLCRRLKRLFSKRRRHSFGIGTAERK